jgi:hypothetical protein
MHLIDLQRNTVSSPLHSASTPIAAGVERRV